MSRFSRPVTANDRRLRGLLAAPVPVVVILLITTAAQSAAWSAVPSRIASLVPTLAPVLYGVTVAIAALVAAPLVSLAVRWRGRHGLMDYAAIGAGTGILTMLAYHTVLTGLSLDVAPGEGLRLLAIGAVLGAASGKTAYWVSSPGRRRLPPS